MAEQAAAPNRLAVTEDEVDQATSATQPAHETGSGPASVAPASESAVSDAFTIVDAAAEPLTSESSGTGEPSARTQDQSMIDLAIEKALDGVRAELEASSAEAIEVAAAEAASSSVSAADVPVGTPDPEVEATPETPSVEQAQTAPVVEDDDLGIDDEAQRLIESGIAPPRQVSRPADPAPQAQPDESDASDTPSEPVAQTATVETAPPDTGAQEMSAPDGTVDEQGSETATIAQAATAEPAAVIDSAVTIPVPSEPAPSEPASTATAPVEPATTAPVPAETASTGTTSAESGPVASGAVANPPVEPQSEPAAAAETAGPAMTDGAATQVETVAEPASATVPDPADQAQTAQPLSQLLARMTPQTSLEDLGQAVTAAGGRPMDQMVEDVLRPLVREWVSENLPSLAERLVREEIEKVSRSRG